MNVIELKVSNYPSIGEQMSCLTDCINRHLKGKKHKEIDELVVDFVTDYRDTKFYFLQIKYINVIPYVEPIYFKPLLTKKQSLSKAEKEKEKPKIHYNAKMKDEF